MTATDSHPVPTFPPPPPAEPSAPSVPVAPGAVPTFGTQGVVMQPQSFADAGMPQSPPFQAHPAQGEVAAQPSSELIPSSYLSEPDSASAEAFAAPPAFGQDAFQMESASGGGVADDPEEILPLSYLETPEEAASEAAMAADATMGPNASAQTARFQGGASGTSSRASGRSSDSARFARSGASTKSKAQLQRDKKAKVIIILGMIAINGLALTLAVLHYTGTLGEWFGY